MPITTTARLRHVEFRPLAFVQTTNLPSRSHPSTASLGNLKGQVFSERDSLTIMYCTGFAHPSFMLAIVLHNLKYLLHLLLQLLPPTLSCSRKISPSMVSLSAYECTTPIVSFADARTLDLESIWFMYFCKADYKLVSTAHC